MHPLVTIVILNYNGRQLLPTPLKSIAKLHYPKNCIETVVVDNGSTDGSRNYIKKWKDVKLVQLPDNQGYSAMNAGIKAARGEFLFLVNNDLAIHPDCVGELVSAYHAVERPGLFGPLMVDPKGNWQTTRYLSRSFYAGGRKIRYKKPKSNIEDAAFLGIVFFHREMIRELGQIWDPDYFLYAEDIDISYRTRVRGRSVVWVHSAIVYHSWDGTISKYFDSPKRAFLSERNLLITFIKNADIRSLILYTPYIILMRFASVLRQLISLRFDVAGAKIRAYWWNIVNIGSTLRKRKIIQSRRLQADKQFIPSICDERKFIREQLGLTE